MPITVTARIEFIVHKHNILLLPSMSNTMLFNCLYNWVLRLNWVGNNIEVGKQVLIASLKLDKNKAKCDLMFHKFKFPMYAEQYIKPHYYAWHYA